MNAEETNRLELQFEKRNGLLPVVVQHVNTREILMVGYTNEEAYRQTLSKGKATFWSTSRQQLWTKGETSGDYLQVENILVDCDQDALVYQVQLLGDGVCHTYNSSNQHRTSCFYRQLHANREQLVNIDP
jgi:phosphoribosyl-AMP cyclohydrolase